MSSTAELVMSPDFLTKVADLIGGTVRPKDVDNFIRLSEQADLVFHGSKRPHTTISTEGVLPLTPEGGRVSWWSRGRRLFNHSLTNSRAFGFDSTFFDHSHSSDGSMAVMTIAVAHQASVNPDSIGNDCVTTPLLVSHDQIHLLRVEIDHGDISDVKPGDMNILAQQYMFRLLERVVSGQFQPGGLDLVQSTF